MSEINLCKHCSIPQNFPRAASSFRDSLKSRKIIYAADLLTGMFNPEFKKIYDAEYCCRDARYDAIDSYKGLINLKQEAKE